ncbi:amino acid ABC transporter permease [Sulfitobacter mediterraneus]|jgi:polar amino acid transport system permease protein|uniref:Amino acid ABC transporter membrane protein 2 (PAAT family) n=1 Tax=Sulfitobacter mediterraneus TaxID=83219 RepID=A0A2T6CA55_9RHOB|nr:amino acid ABC transporter permease [Sulfitobacter mediterraneus]KIN78211.1 Polar amino acid ABC transporter inner membrane subunit [Sulfitobacter mediterraneus KCTC 32188]MBM1311303.1 amino acid ABC transporter permease [Sulfitobacter mediterraneus]MBM1315185.1 amino acid ABC transporter permease [Sulfitobacter mediterraneus]MBM1323546.1 amino acid ABC transporter permease [Sulfitobacter mediterraneus]MBM1327458.1 amino acid ABC transporter permease [Sulfitobacter mediterraneus]
MGLDFSIVPKYMDVILLGCAWTIGITVAAALLSFFGGIVFAVIALYGPWLLRQPFRLFAWLFMGTPLLLQLFLIYFGLVQIGIDLPAFVAGIIGLGLHFAVYNSELIQTAILAVDKGQMEAARTLGLSRGEALRKVVIPQAVRAVLPPIGNNMIALLKDSALVSVIGVSELTLSAQRVIGKTYRPFEFYLLAAACYYVINLGMEWVQRRIERRISISR